jgi:hypothetical protein
MTDDNTTPFRPPLKPVPAASRCRCGAWLPHGSTARKTAHGEYYDCYACRPRDTEPVGY